MTSPTIRLIPRWAALAVAASAVAVAAQQPPAPASQQPAPSSRASVESASPASPARRRASRCPDLIALSPDKETQDAARVDRRGAVGRPELRARVLHDPARYL